MANNWDYVPEEREKAKAGDYRLEVLSASDGFSKTSNNPMITIVVQPNGTSVKISHYFVKNEYFNRNTTEFFDSFGITRGDFNILGWVGAVGAGRLKEDGDYLKVAYFIDPAKAAKLPEWVGEKPERQTITTLGESEDNSPIPFDELPD